jgi:pSer/pThr/pTyr-binding forkhead associated (FHA) protein
MSELPSTISSMNATLPDSAIRAPFTPLRLRREASGEIVEIDRDSAVIGRHTECDLRLVDPDVSRRHCRIGVEDGMWRIVDLASTNGIFLNGVRLAEANLYPGDRLRIGSIEFVVERAMPQRGIRGMKSRTIEAIAKAVSQ